MEVKTDGLNFEEICKIIRISAKSGVSLLKIGGLHVEFDSRTEYPFAYDEKTKQWSMGQINAPRSVEEVTEEQHEQLTKEAIEAEELNLRQEQIAQALIEDPVKYEELIRDEELTDVDASDETDE